jgi:hypothetical protein
MVFTNKLGALPENVLQTLLNDRLVAKGTVQAFMTTFFQVGVVGAWRNPSALQSKTGKSDSSAGFKWVGVGISTGGVARRTTATGGWVGGGRNIESGGILMCRASSSRGLTQQEPPVLLNVPPSAHPPLCCLPCLAPIPPLSTPTHPTLASLQPTHSPTQYPHKQHRPTWPRSHWTTW